MNLRTPTAFAAGAIVTLVLGTGTAYAANGGRFILGRNNYASSASSLNNAYGTALILRSKAGQPSLKVNRTAKVPNLNADLVDGVNSSNLARNVRVGTVIASGVTFDSDLDGTDDSVIALAVCPAGSQVVGGGAYDGSDDGVPFISVPDGTDAWFVVSDTSTISAGNADLVEAHARCWHPLKNVADQDQATLARKISPQARTLARKVGTR